MSRADAAQAGQSKSNIYVVTLPDGQVVIGSIPLLHNEECDPTSILLFANFLVCCELDCNRITFKESNKKITVYQPWINIFQFLLGQEIGNFYSYDPYTSPLARFSACVVRPSLLLAKDDVVRAALCGDEDFPLRMIALNPNYLLQHGRATDFSGRQYDNLTPWQAALVTGDDKMAEMMKPYFDRLPNGQLSMQKQVEEIFLNGIEAHEWIQKEESKTKFVPMLEAVITAIKDAKKDDLKAALSLEDNHSTLCKALDTFRGAFTKLSHSEKIFNPYHLLKAFEAYADKFDWDVSGCDVSDWNVSDWNKLNNLNKLNLFWRQVIGFVQRFLPANYAQVFAYSLYEIVEKKDPCRPRSFNFENSAGGFSFYPLAVPFSGLGFNYGICGGGRTACTCVPWRRAVGVAAAFQKLCRTKTASFQNLLRSERNQLTVA